MAIICLDLIKIYMQPGLNLAAPSHYELWIILPGSIGTAEMNPYCTNDPDTANARLPSRTFKKPGMRMFSFDFAGRRP